MSSRLSKHAMRVLRGVVERRTRRNSWAYILWLLAYMPPTVFFAGDLSFDVRPHQLLPLLVPITVVLMQLAYPTLVGWAVVFIPSGFFAGVMVFFVVITAPGRVQHDMASLVISSIAAGAYLLVCVALWFARPKLASALIADPGAAANRVPATPPGSSRVTEGPPSS